MKNIFILLLLACGYADAQTFAVENLTVAGTDLWNGYYSSINYPTVAAGVSTMSSGGLMHIPPALNPTLPAQLGNVSLMYDGPNTIVDAYGIGDGLGQAAVAIKGQNSGSHTSYQAYQFAIQGEPVGNGSASAGSGDATLGITALKQGYPGSMTTKGQVSGLNVTVRGGYTGTFGSGNGDVSAIDTNVVVASNDFAAAMESATYVANSSGVITQGMDTQIGGMSGENTSYIGFYANALNGTLSSAFQASATGSGASWNNLLVNVVPAGYVNFSINSNGFFTQYPVGSLTSAVITQNNGGQWQLLNNSSALMASVNQSGQLKTVDYPVGTTPYSPTITSTSGSINVTVNSAYYIKRGSLTYVDIYYVINSQSSAGGALIVSTPETMDASGFVSGNGFFGPSYGFAGPLFASSTTLSWTKYDGTTPCTTLSDGHLSFYYLSTVL